MKHAKATTNDKHAGYIAWKEWNAAGFGLYTIAERVEFANELRRAGINLKPMTHVLEIGFGNGAFAGWVRQFTKHYVGTEANDELIARAVEAGIEAYSATINVSATARNRSYDLIVAFDILEHLELDELIDLLKSCRNCLSKDGLMLIRVPSGDSPFSGPLFNGDITHRTLLGSKAFTQIALLTGYEVVSARETVLPVFGLGLRKAVERTIVKFARKFTALIVRAAFLGNKQAVITSNMIVVLKPAQHDDMPDPT